MPGSPACERGDRAATTPFPSTNTGEALGGLPLGSAGFSYAAPGMPRPDGLRDRGATRASATSPWGDDHRPGEPAWTEPEPEPERGADARDPDGLYALLDLTPDATAEEVKRAFRLTAQRTHPDTADGDPEKAEAAFKAVARAYRVLSDPREPRRLRRPDLTGSRPSLRSCASALRPPRCRWPVGSVEHVHRWPHLDRRSTQRS